MSEPLKTRVKPTLDELFAVKRAERPEQSFWDDFERGLRQKQLAAIVLPRPWWHAPSLWARKAAPYGGFAAAAAALALAFTTLRAPVAFEGSANTALSAPARGVVAPLDKSVAVVRPVSAPAAPAELASPPLVAAGLPAGGANGAAAEAVVVAAAIPARLEITLSASGASLAGTATASGGDIPHFVAEPVAAEVLPLAPVLAEAPLPEGLLIEPPAVLRTRHDRLLAKALEDTPGEEDRSLAQVRERVVHRLADGEELYASITRVGVSGDRLSLKF